MIRSYIAKYRAAVPGQRLIGDVAESQSHRWGAIEDASRYLASVIETNGGTAKCVGEVVPSTLLPESIPHCLGKPEQSEGGKCFGCGKVITRKDLQDWRPKSIYQLLKEADIEVASHESDLYCPVTEKSTEIIKMFYYPWKNTTTFKDNITGKPWYDVPFSFDPFYETKAKART